MTSTYHEPTSINEAIQERDRLLGEIQSIDAQLTVRKQARGWRRRALGAKAVKLDVYRQYKNWITHAVGTRKSYDVELLQRSLETLRSMEQDGVQLYDEDVHLVADLEERLHVDI